jgi:tetrahydromethanopterin S-methyltransferase subunit G
MFVVIQPKFKFGDKFHGNMPEITDHAVARARERFNPSKKGTRQWVQDHLLESKYVNTIQDGVGNWSNLFVHDNVLIAITTDNKQIKTVMTNGTEDESKASKGLQTRKEMLSHKIEKIIRVEIKKTQKKFKSTVHNNNLFMAELDIERAELRLKLLRARSEANKNAYKARIKAINERIDELNNEIEQVNAENRQVAHSVALYMR